MSTFWIIVLIVLGLNHLVNTLTIISEEHDYISFRAKIIAFVVYFFCSGLFSVFYIITIKFWEWNREEQTLLAQSVSLIKIWWRYIIKRKKIDKKDYQPMLEDIRFWYRHWENSGRVFNRAIKHQVLKIYLIAMNRYKQQLKDTEVLQNPVNKIINE